MSNKKYVGLVEVGLIEVLLSAFKGFVVAVLLFHFLAPVAQGFEYKDVFAMISGKESCSSLEELREQLEQDSRFTVWGETDKPFGYERYLIVSAKGDWNVPGQHGCKATYFNGERANVVKPDGCTFVQPMEIVPGGAVVFIGLPLQDDNNLLLMKKAEKFGKIDCPYVPSENAQKKGSKGGYFVTTAFDWDFDKEEDGFIVCLLDEDRTWKEYKGFVPEGTEILIQNY